MIRLAADVTPYRHLYVHVPFCARRCSYCDFAIAVRREVPVAAFVRAIQQELDVRQCTHGIEALDTLYFGGGTPSLLGADGVQRLLDVIKRAAPLKANAEVTLEANPEDVTPDAVRAWRAAGITRLSIGVQSFSDAVLKWMHRVHTADDALRAVDHARNGGLHALSLDLIFSLPEFLERDWKRDLDAVVALHPDHVSVYGLTIEPRTPLGKWHARGEVRESPEEQYESEFLVAHRQLCSAGYEHYEVSNYSKPERRALHNSAYWSGAPYLGVGPSAHGFDGASRRWNISAFAEWAAATAAGNDPQSGQEVLTPANRMAETVYLGLRSNRGLEVTPAELESFQSWQAAGWIERVRNHETDAIRCTPQGWLLLDKLASDLTAVRSH